MNKLDFIFLCLARKLLEITDDIAIGKIWKDHQRDEFTTVAQSKNSTDVCVDDAMSNLDVRMQALQEILWPFAQPGSSMK